VLAYTDELGVRYVYDTTAPNGRYVAIGDLAARSGTGARTAQAPTSNTEQETASVQVCQLHDRVQCPDEEELTVREFTANYSRTFRLADRPMTLL
jgi:hypothetical protein